MLKWLIIALLDGFFYVFHYFLIRLDVFIVWKFMNVDKITKALCTIPSTLEITVLVSAKMSSLIDMALLLTDLTQIH